ncbi:hypothetical protein HOLleu_33741 [Holothuria leucospilota]|uniref:Uncharacterized protein n=1 Tax=Holothuria leucospilota TaxID=206669 RepID=A0A9Q1BGV0_HOLLE|nr:hypothetical protein HOLleu_33741 [Holothuria leucospilota]
MGFAPFRHGGKVQNLWRKSTFLKSEKQKVLFSLQKYFQRVILRTTHHSLLK